MPPWTSSPELFHGIGSETRSSLELVCDFAHTHLTELSRRSGENYAQHGFEVASTLRELTADAPLLSAAILHDLLVHPEGETLLLQAPIGEEERKLIREMHALRRLHIDANAADLDLALTAFIGDTSLLPLRMAHRLTDVRHLARFPRVLQKQIAHESLHMYAAIAGRLGMHRWRYEMEDICFRILQPHIAERLEQTIQRSLELDTTCLRQMKEYLLKALQEEGITASIDWRIKTLYSTYRKMVIKRRTFPELTDRLALRIVVPEIKDCYTTLGITHAILHPMPGKLKDYIGIPKENGYRSIHTVVYPLPGVNELPIEIQIRTREMHEECEYGVAKHGEYKNYLYALSARSARVNLFRNLEILREEAKSPKKFEEALRTYFGEDHIAIFDARNNLYHLKVPATALDFLCKIYGRRCKFLKTVSVNGRERPLDTPLHDGDTVDAKFGKDAMVKPSWMHACKHAGTRKMLASTLPRK